MTTVREVLKKKGSYREFERKKKEPMNPLLRIVFKPLTGLLSALIVAVIAVAKSKYPAYTEAIDLAVPHLLTVLQTLGIAVTLQSQPLGTKR